MALENQKKTHVILTKKESVRTLRYTSRLSCRIISFLTPAGFSDDTSTSLNTLEYSNCTSRFACSVLEYFRILKS